MQDLRSTTDDNVVSEERRAVLSDGSVECSSTINIQSAIKIGCTSYVEGVINYSCTCNVKRASDVCVTRSTCNDKLVSVDDNRSTNVDVRSRVDSSDITCGSTEGRNLNRAIKHSVTISTEECDCSCLVGTNVDILTEVRMLINTDTTVGNFNCCIINQTRRCLILGEFNDTTEFLVTFLDDVTVYLKVTIDLHVTTDCQVVANRNTTSNLQSTRGREVVTS